MEPTIAIAGIRGFDPTSSSLDASASAVPTTGVASGPTFVEALQSAARTTISDLRNAEQISLQALTGNADVRDVADAVMSAEQNLQAAIAIRDKIVTAFLEISRMQI
ncbi:flagellar hook-basal body complex protein FliE [Oricola thermophila]|uniref:Flagellar hook-basal body complex protein FliE n=1 Tax=Oricola thermophila TaxID=2742145 RepID=A0A6N1VIT7_9HYPH|nr:flagellar hook-basal body complex protein FliE [Oricola thermophila]QKV19645.1 flagellar hook-basal body complex protein FliE [Oricola thermophila]